MDNTDFCANGESYESNMQEIMKTYTILFKVTSEKFKSQKYFYIVRDRYAEVENKA